MPFPHLHRRATILYQLWSQAAQASVGGGGGVGTELPQKPAEVGIVVNGASWEETGPALSWEERWSRTEKKKLAVSEARSERGGKSSSVQPPASFLTCVRGHLAAVPDSWFASQPLSSCSRLLPASSSETETALPQQLFPPSWFWQPNGTQPGAVTGHEQRWHGALAGTHTAGVLSVFWLNSSKAGESG